MDREGYVPRFAPEIPSELLNNAGSGPPLYAPPPHKVCGFWRRFNALLEDFIILGIIGGLLGYVLMDFLIGLGVWGRLIGFVIALFYFGLLNGSYGNGQTLGKRWCKIKVVDGDGTPISHARSFGRFSVIGFPLCISGIFVSTTGTIFDIFITFLSVLGSTLFVALLYFLIFNRGNRRLLHDEIFDTYVVSVESKGEVTLPRTWIGHWVFSVVLCIGVIGVMFLLGFISMAMSAYTTDYAGLNELRNAMLSIEGVQDVGVHVQSTVFLGTGGSYVTTPQLQVVLQKDSRVTYFEDDIRKIIPIVLKETPSNLKHGNLVIIIQYGYDIWFANYFRSGWAGMKFEEWENFTRRLDRHLEIKLMWTFDSIYIGEMD